jgi:hypothetical protein
MYQSRYDIAISLLLESIYAYYRNSQTTINLRYRPYSSQYSQLIRSNSSRSSQTTIAQPYWNFYQTNLFVSTIPVSIYTSRTVHPYLNLSTPSSSSQQTPHKNNSSSHALLNSALQRLLKLLCAYTLTLPYSHALLNFLNKTIHPRQVYSPMKP